MHQGKVRVERGVEHRHDVIAGEREEMPGARRHKRTGNDVGAAH
jgi:hypothetical protein